MKQMEMTKREREIERDERIRARGLTLRRKARMGPRPSRVPKD
jgi:hypothetical protein